MPPLILIPAGIEAIELGEAAYAAWRIYRLARAAQAAARAAEDLKLVVQVANIALQSRAAVTGCATCPKEAIPCFSTPEKGTNEEMDRQLKEQQDEINKISPDEMLENLRKNRGPDGKIIRPPADQSSRRIARDDALQKRAAELKDEYLRQNYTLKEAEAKARETASRELAGKDMAHAPDLRAGGDGTLSPDPAGSSENRSIGSQWNQKGDGDARARGDILEQEAANAKARGDKKMNVELTRCKQVS